MILGSWWNSPDLDYFTRNGFRAAMFGLGGIDSTKASQIGGAFRDAGVLIAEGGAYVNLTSEDPTHRRSQIENLIEFYRIAPALGARCVATTAGSCDPRGHNHPHPDNWSSEGWKRVVDAITTVLDTVPANGVSFCIEAWPVTTISHPKDVRRLLDEVGDERLSVLFDPANFITRENYYRTGDIVKECLDLFADRIACCHLKDVRWERLSMLEVVVGTGNFDIAAFLEAIKPIGKGMPILFEHLFEESEYQGCRDYVLEMSEKLGIDWE